MLAVAFLVAGTMTVSAFVALTTTTTLTVMEPLTILTIGGTFGAGTPLTCSSSGTTATCTGSANAGESGTIDLQVGNFASVSISVTVLATSSSGFVLLGPPSNTVPAPPFSQTFTIPAATTTGPTHIIVPGSISAQVPVSISQSAAPGPITITITV